MIIRFKDFRTVKDYGKEIYTTNDPEDARVYMKNNKDAMRFLPGGGKIKDGDYAEIYWDIITI